MQKLLLVLFSVFLLGQLSLRSQTLYFPPLSASANWDTISPSSLGWCLNEIDTLYNFLQQKNTKGFIVLKNGKIVLEKYFGTFNIDSLWYWASASKTITSLLVGKAQEENYLSILDTTADYLGTAWTYCTPAQEKKITLRHQLTMTTGLDDGVPDNHCTLDSCLIYKADAGTRWAYHNAPYTLLEGVLTAATAQNINVYTQTKLKIKTGMNGFWLTSGYDNVYYSTARSMARFGLLVQNNCIWSSDTVLKSVTYKNQMISTSQNFNLSYGYLWWLNGKNSYMVPASQLVIPGPYAPNAPSDMFAGIGKNGQLVSISKGSGLVMVRMGNAPGNTNEVSTQFCDEIWKKLNAVMCNATSVTELKLSSSQFLISPNPVDNTLQLSCPLTVKDRIDIINPMGECVLQTHEGNIPKVSELSAGIYFLRLSTSEGTFTVKFIKN